jgi:hypothetical protein
MREITARQAMSEMNSPRKFFKPGTLSSDPLATLLNANPFRVIGERMLSAPSNPVKEMLDIGLNGFADIAPNTVNPLANPKDLNIGDRVTSETKKVANIKNYGGFVLGVMGDRAIVMWDLGLPSVVLVSDLQKVK